MSRQHAEQGGAQAPRRSLDESFEQGARRTQYDLALRARERLIAEAAHDLRSPLNGIQGWTHVLESRLGSDASPILRKALEGIKTGVQQQVALIANLADMRSILDGQFALETAPTDASGLLARALERVAPFAQARRVTFAQGIPPAGVSLAADAEQLARAFEAIAVHCIRCAVEGDAIPVGMAQRDGWVFWHFGEDGSRPATAGLGAGPLRVPASLRLAESLVRLHGGQVEHVAPAHEGGAVGYRVGLPMVPVDPSLARSTAAARLAMPSAAPRVAVLDEGQVPQALLRGLRQLGIEPHVVTTPLAADAPARFDVLLVPLAAATQVPEVWSGAWLAFVERGPAPEVLPSGTPGIIAADAAPAWLAACLCAAIASGD